MKAKPEVRRTRWFDEAFASYFEAIALREFAGQKAFDDRMAGYRERFRSEAKKNSRNATTPIAEYGKEELGDNSYTKAKVYEPFQGLTISRSQSWKSATLRVASLAPRTWAMAAICASAWLIGLPSARR